MLRKLLLFITLFITSVLSAQTLYWVGGSGNFNDVHHWSLTSGGVSSRITPNPATDLIFDNNSSANDLVINITGLNHIKSLKIQNTNHNYHFTGSNISMLHCSGDFILNEKSFFSANTKLIFSNYSSNYSYVNFWKNIINADVIFEDGNWDLQSVKIADNNLLKINKGNYKVSNASVIAGNLVSVADNVSFISTHSTFYIKNRVILGNKVSFKSNDLVFIAQKNNPALYNVNSNVNFGTNSKIFGINPKPLACSITYSFTSPSCNGSCDASITIGFGAGCTTGPYDLLFNNGSGCFPNGANGVVPPVYSLSSLCSCGGLLDVFVFDGVGLVASLSNLSTPQAPTPINMSFSGLKQPRCFNLCDGSVNIFNSGGSPPYDITILSSPSGSVVATYTNIPAVTTTTITNLCAGTFSFVTTDNNGCNRTFTTTMTQPTPITPNGSVTNVSCNGVCNGSGTVSPTGGVGPYTFSWLSSVSTPSSSTTSTIGTLCPGVVTMTVSDSKTCTATYSANITQPPPINLTVTKIDLNCRNICNGSASVTATGGLGPFTYSWSPSGGTGSQATGLCAGNYTCTVTNNGNCIKTITVAILSPPTLTATPTQTNILCNNVCNGAINLNTSGGTLNYSYVWSPNISNTITASALCDGVYSYTITDALGCKFINSVTITEPPASTLTIAPTSITCNGACDGTAIGNMSGGTLAYTYSWSPGNPTGQNTASISALCPNTYTLKVTDGNGCITNQTVTITQPTVISLVTTSTSPTCNGVCNGSITATPSGGTGPYTYTLQSSGAPSTIGPSANASFTNLCAGSYTLTVRDTKGCVQTRTINLTQPNPVTLALPFTPINCFNACNSSISTVVGGGVGPYTFTWSPPGSGNSQINQCAGVHSATVTDNNGCKASTTITITSQPDLTVSIVPTNPNCNSQCTGIATTTVTGGTPNYIINFSNGASGNIINNLCQGTYTATVIDFFGCTKTQTVAITTPPALTLTPINGTVSCTGSNDGTVSVTPTGGTAGYFYSWSPTAPTQTTAIANALIAGNYVVTVTDALGCIASTVAAVAQPTVLTASIGNVQPSCNVCIGSATANGIGGTFPYTYSWSPGGQVGQSPNTLCAGIQTLTVTDIKGCTTTQTVQINQTVITLITTNGNTLACNGSCTGFATANPVGGVAPYSYTWTPAAVAPIQNTKTAIGLCAGIHTVMVSDINGCSSTNTVTFTNPPAITLTVNQTNVNCNGSCNGTASANAIGGTGIISYLWQPGGQTTSSINGLCAGAYTVTATDGNSCSQTQVVTIIENSLLTATFTPSSPSTCTSSDGSITAVIGGGLPTYTITWNGGSNANPLVNIGAGSYTLSIIDAAGCTQSISTTLSNPTGPTVTAVSNSITCFGACTGSATLNIVGTGPFNVNGSVIAGNITTLSGLCSGIITPIITDATSCVTNQTLNIAQPTQLTANGVVTHDPCNASCNGSINLTPSGGTLPYSYVWSPAGVGQDPTNLCASNYTVNISDGNGCLTTNTYVVTEPPALTLSFNKKDVLCNGQCSGGVRAIVVGGTGPYTYTWTPSPPFAGANIDTLVNICSGIYSVSASDANGCIVTGTIDIGQPIALTSTITSINQKCFGQCNGSATIIASGGVAPYSYNYNTTPITPTQTIGGLCIGTYTGGVSDANGCVSSNSFVITQPLPIVVTTTLTNPTCNAVCNGSVATTVTGGNPTYHYNWIPSGGPVSSPTGLCAGNYTVIVTDDSLCIGQALVVLTDPAILLANASFTNPSCNAGCNGVVTASPIGGTGPFIYSWTTPVVNTQTVSNLCAGIYTLTLNDANSCQAVQTVTLTDPPAIIINPSLAPATCGVPNGSINAIASNGVAPYAYNWLDPLIIVSGQTTNTMVTNIPAGTYTVVVTDNAGCSTTSVIPLSNSNGPSGATITSTNVTCNSQCNGAADVSNPLGGTAPYTLSWINPVSPSSIVSGLCAGTYTAEIADANNCLFFQSVIITEPQTIDDNEIITSAACLGNCNGSIALNPSGGNGGYTYSWTPTASAGTISNICPGVYTATITDVLGCTLTANYTLPSITTITSSTFATNNLCSGNCNGSILATNVAGGLPQYTFVWSDVTGQTSSTASGLCNGNYSVTITDANGCFNVIPAVMTSPAPVTFTPTITQPSCNLCNGSAIINAAGGTPPYTYLWSNNQVVNTATSLCSGLYMLDITDVNGCVNSTSVVINNSSGITSETIVSTNVTCSGNCDGTINITAVGGTAPISYNWVHDGSTTQSISGLCSGTYFCNMIDVTGCSRTASVVIGTATTLSISSQVSQSSCTAPTGSITVNATGGSGGPYTYTWLPSGSTPTVTNLSPGNYTLTVSDGNCSQTQVFSVNSFNAPLITSTQSDITCSALCNGNISITISGGIPTYTTQWSTGTTGITSINGLCAGTYSVIVTDAAGCSAVKNYSLTTISAIAFSSPDLNNPQCHDDCNGSLTAIPLGGTMPYTFSWTPSNVGTATTNSLCAGNYSITVTDANGCLASDTYSLVNPATLTLTAVVTDASCNTALDGAIDITITGGGAPINYNWTPGNIVTEDLTNVLSGSYTITATDNFGCVIDSNLLISATIVVNAIAGNDRVFCQNGTLLLDGSNSNGGITYEWFESPLVAPIASTLITSVSPSVGTTTYVLIATNGACVDKDTIIVSSNALPVVDAGPMINMPIFSSASIGGNPTGPSGSTFNWNPVLALDNPTNANPTSGTTVTTIYTVTVIDGNGCANSDTVTVFISPEIRIPNGFSPNGDGKNDVWQIDNIYQFPDCEVEVYNRWGEQLFYSKGYAVPFNGQYKGKDLPVGTYYYIINLNHPAYPDAYTSPLTIFR